MEEAGELCFSWDSGYCLSLIFREWEGWDASSIGREGKAHSLVVP